MKTKISVLLITFMLFFGFTGLQAQNSTQAKPQIDEQSEKKEYENLSKKILQAFFKGDYKTVTSMLDEEMQKLFTKKNFDQSVSQLRGLGKIEAVKDFEFQKQDNVIITDTTVVYENMSLKLRLVFDADKKISGLQFLPVQKEFEYTPPGYVDESKFTEQEITVGSGDWALPGTLSMPVGEGSFPAVVLVHGSGPNDRDETIYRNKPFRDIAWGLASKGIAVVRYDKRTLVHGQKLSSVYDTFTVEQETIEDALLAVQLLRETENIDKDRIFVIGHSLGGMLIPRIGKADDKIAGLISLAGPTRHLADIIVYQYIYLYALDGNITDEEMDAIEKIIEIRDKVKDKNLCDDTPISELMNVPVSYWKDLQDYKPAELSKSLSHPMLILQGERDYQVTMRDYDGWVDAISEKENVTFKSYEKLNHLFLEGDGQSKPEEYTIESHIPKYVMDDIIDWINSEPKHTQLPEPQEKDF